MSYILEALRRADAERERGAVPGLHAQPMAADIADATPPRAGHRWRWLGGALGLGLLLLGAWVAWSPDDAPTQLADAGPVTAEPVSPAPVAAVPAPASPPPAAVPPAPLVVEPVAPPPVTAPRDARRTATPRQPPAAASRSAAAEPAKPAAAVPGPAAPASAAATAAASASVAAASAPPAGRLPSLAELPAEIRSALPQLAVGGAIHSQDPASRMLVLNGRVFHEGGKPTPELTLEQIGLKSAVFSFRGHRYEMSY